MHRSIALLLVACLGTPARAQHRRAVLHPSTPVLAAVMGTEVTATNYGTTASLVQRCTDDQGCITDLVPPGATQRYAINGQVMRIGPIDTGTVDVQSDGLTLPRSLFLTGTKIVPGTYDLAQFTQTILILSDHAGALGLKSVSQAGTTQEVRTIPYTRGITRVDPSTTFLNIDPDFQFEITDSPGLAIEWRSKQTGTVTRIPAVRVEDALVDACLPHVTPATILLLKNAMLVQQGGINLFFQPTAGLDALTFGRGAPLQPYGMISITDAPAFAGSSGEGSLRLQGAPEAPTFQPSDPFYAWALTDGTPYPVTSVQLTASAHATCAPNLATYHNLRWNGLRTDTAHHTDVAVQNTISQPATGTLVLDENGAVIAAQTISLAGYASARLTLDPLVGTHAVYNATLQLDDTDKTSCDNPFVAGLASVTGPNGTSVRAPLTVSRPAPTAYDVTATIQVRDNGQTFAQTTHPAIGIIQQLTNVTTPDALVGSHGYDCTPAPDPVVNSIPELLAHYATLTPAEQQEFSGDRAGFAPFAANGCDTTKNQYVLFISITILKRVSAQAYVAKWYDPITSKIIYLDGRESRCLINGNCGTRSYAPDLAAALYPTSKYAGTQTEFETYLRGLADGDPVNGELYRQKDPIRISGQAAAQYQVFSLDPNDGVINIDLDSTHTAAVLAVYRSFLVDMTTAHPEEYGGNASGLNLGLAPGWDTRHNNDSNGYRLP